MPKKVKPKYTGGEEDELLEEPFEEKEGTEEESLEEKPTEEPAEMDEEEAY